MDEVFLQELLDKTRIIDADIISVRFSEQFLVDLAEIFVTFLAISLLESHRHFATMENPVAVHCTKRDRRSLRTRKIN